LKSWWSRRIPELVLVAIGCALRISMSWTYDVNWGYDFFDHWPYINWFAHHLDLPPIDLSRETWHPPLYYFLAGQLVRAGASQQFLGGVSALIGCARLLLIWYGIERYLTGGRVARLCALALAVVLPASLHMDGMAYPEGLNNLLATGALVLLPRAFGAARTRLKPALGVGLLLGLELLTKVSAMALLGAVGLVVVAEFVFDGNGGWRGRLARLAPFVATLALMSSVCGWYYLRNYRLYHKPFLASFDGRERAFLGKVEQTPYLQRRPAAFYYGWDNAIYRLPYYPSGILPESRFWPPVVGSTFVDYYNFGFSPHPPKNTQTAPIVNTKRLRPTALVLSRFSVAGGTPIAIAVAVAWLVATASAIRRRRFDRLALLSAPFMVLAGQLHFATRYPIDFVGPIKALYMQFGASPLYGLFGLAVERLWNARIWGRALALLLVAGLALVASYTLYCRLV
jgi:hypothetical protein